MPPRLITGAILLFWLAMTGWLIQREVVPMMVAAVSPSYQIDLTDEIGSPAVYWILLLNDEPIGRGDSRIVLKDDRTYEFRSTLHFKKSAKFPLEIQQWESTYRVTEDGKLAALASHFTLAGMTWAIEGEVQGGILQPRMSLNGHEIKEFALGTINVSQQGNIINPMHPVNRLRGLSKGQTWQITLFDPLRAIDNQLLREIAKQAAPIPSLIAEVKTDTLRWYDKEVPCFKIEYSEPGKEPTAATWVRMRDGLVLQQEATHLGFRIRSQRTLD